MGGRYTISFLVRGVEVSKGAGSIEEAIGEVGVNVTQEFDGGKDAGVEDLENVPR